MNVRNLKKNRTVLTVPRVFYNILWIAFSRIRLNSLRKILKKTYAAEILYGMLLLIVAVVIVLPGMEPSIRDVGDGLWYSFSLVTTIGLGDIAAVTIPGRILSVILGLYGLVVVALVTSVIVNLYNETKSPADPEDGKDAGEKNETAV